MASENIIQIKSLMHFDTKPLFDHGGRVKWAKVGNATLSTNSPKFGTTCFYFPDKGSYVLGKAKNSDVFKMPDMEKIIPLKIFEFEFFIKLNEANSQDDFLFFTFYGDNTDLSIPSPHMIFGSQQHTTWENLGNSKWNSYLSDPSCDLSQWTHIIIRFCFDYNEYWYKALLFVNGYCRSTALISDICDISEINTVKLGGFIGYVDEFSFKEIIVGENYMDKSN